MRDVELRQRNIVFPDTAWNEARFWRNLISRERLNAAQVIAIVLICGVLAAPVWDIFHGMTSIKGWLFLGGCCGFFLLLRWRVRRALKVSASPEELSPHTLRHREK